MKRLVLAAAAWAAIEAQARDAWPHECCGVLVGALQGEAGVVARAVAAANVAAEPRRRFEVDPAVLLATHRRAREAGQEVLGPYHSHPDGAAVPSATDTARARAAAGAGEVWLIVPATTAGAGTPRAFVFDGDGFAEITLDIQSGGA